MTKPDDRDTLLVVVGTKSQATAVETALFVQRIAARVHQNVAKVIEFGGTLGVHPFEVYVRREDLVRAREIVVAKGLPHDGGESGIQSAIGM